MTKKQHKSLDQRYFHDDESQTDSHEVKQRRDRGSLPGSVQCERYEQETRHRDDRDDEHRAENCQTEIILPVPFDSIFSSRRKERVQNTARFEGEEKKRSIVG